ncbi:MAG: hypothetical protein ACOVKV_15280 [Novosphingobium sp.]
MRLTRRTMLKGGALVGSAAASPAIASAAVLTAPVVVFDSRIPESSAFAATAFAAPGIDIASGLVSARKSIGKAQIVTGLTRWSDWTVIRGLLEAQGLRLKEEVRQASPISGRTHLFRWTMAAR